jgi:hypothetical protein
MVGHFYCKLCNTIEPISHGPKKCPSCGINMIVCYARYNQDHFRRLGYCEICEARFLCLTGATTIDIRRFIDLIETAGGQTVEAKCL